LSPAVGGWLAQWNGYAAAFLTLGAFALGSVVVWLRFAPVLDEARGKSVVAAGRSAEGS